MTNLLYDLINLDTGKLIKQRYLDADDVRLQNERADEYRTRWVATTKGRTLKHYRFYLEYPTKAEKGKASIRAGRLGNHSGTVVAAYEMKPGYLEGFVAVRSDVPNGSVNWGGIGQAYLEDRCIRISQQLARAIHPRLFERLDDSDD